jgi:hypothetical protein
MEFQAFPKIARYSRDCIISEKIDGTNASIYIGEDGEFKTGSRTRWITPENDNFGFAMWAQKHKAELMLLGPGHHFGEWWGVGIQRGYELSERRFSLFRPYPAIPPCCHTVPILYTGPFETGFINATLTSLSTGGSKAAPGYMKPEGIVIFHQAARIMFKKTIENDSQPKGVVDEKAAI